MMQKIINRYFNRQSFLLRIKSMATDQFLIIVSAMVCVLLGGLFAIPDQVPIESTLAFKILIALLWALILNKDGFRGRSPGKIRYSLQVFTSKGEIAGPVRCLLRNLTIFIWPIELIFILFNQNRRLGDYFAGTNVDYYDASRNARSNTWQFVSTLLMTFICMFILIDFTTTHFNI